MLRRINLKHTNQQVLENVCLVSDTKIKIWNISITPENFLLPLSGQSPTQRGNYPSNFCHHMLVLCVLKHFKSWRKASFQRHHKVYFSVLDYCLILNASYYLIVCIFKVKTCCRCIYMYVISVDI